MEQISKEIVTKCLEEALLPVARAAGNSIGANAVMCAGDWVSYWRMKNAVYIGEKVSAFLKSRGINTEEQLRSIPAKFGLLYIQGASVEDNDSLRALWAKLLANALDPNFDPEKLSNAFFDVLRGLDPLDAKILHYWYGYFKEKGLWNDYVSQILEKIPYEDACRALDILPTDYELSVHNLVRLQCVKMCGEPTWENLGDMTWLNFEKITLTPFGIRFMEACVAE